VIVTITVNSLTCLTLVGFPTPESEQTMDVTMDDPAKRPLEDPLMIARFKKFPEGGAERKLLKEWLGSSSKAAQEWMEDVDQAKTLFQTKNTQKRSLTARDVNIIKDYLGIQDDIREIFSSRGVQPKVLKTLFSDPKDYDVKPCSEDSLTYLLCQSYIDILIGMCYLSTHSTPLDSLNGSDITAAANVADDGYQSISPLQSLKK